VPTLKEKHSKEVELVLYTAYALSAALGNESKLDSRFFSLDQLCGFSGMSFRHFMNKMGEIPDISYLEVGTYCGSTLLSFLYRNLSSINHAYAIDNWSEFNEIGNYSRDTFFKNLDFLHPNRPSCLKIIEDDCFALDKSEIKHKINFYFYDGPHSEKDHYNAYVYYDDILADCFVTAVDDWNSVAVKKGTQKAFKELNYQIIASWEIDTSDKKGWSEDPDREWWRGVYIAVIQKPLIDLDN